MTPLAIREAVIAIRKAKLPDPEVVANNGSFFANPIISQDHFAQLQADNDSGVPHWVTQEGLVKISAAWLLDRAGFKDHHDAGTGMGTWLNPVTSAYQRGCTFHSQPLGISEEGC